MSTESLSSPIRELVSGSSQKGVSSGQSEKDKGQVQEWITKVAQGFVSTSQLEFLNSELVPRTYLVANELTTADIALYGALHPIVASESSAQHYGHPALTRYFDHIQSRPAVLDAVDALGAAGFSTVSFDLDGMPPLERKSDPPKKKKENKSTPTSQATAPQETSSLEKSAVTQTTVAAEGTIPPSGPPTEKKKKEKKPGKAPEEPDNFAPAPSMIDLRVGRIVEVKKHPDADSLYVEQIDIGEETGPRTVVSGLVKYVPIEEMQSKLLVAVCNLKPATMRGVKSFAMVLCATSKDGKEGGIEIIDPPPGSVPGDRVFFEGEQYENSQPLPQLNPKRKIFETIQQGFITLPAREAAWIDSADKSVHRIVTKNGPCTAKTLVGASLS